jgi:uncharacterized protein
MIDSIREISNPILRAIAAGIFLGSLVTIPTALAVQLVKSPQDSDVESNSKLVVYTGLVSTAIGAAIGLGAGKRKDDLDRSPDNILVQTNDSVEVESSNNRWTDWRKFIVMRKVKESDGITSFYLQPEDDGAIPDFSPGQFLTLKLDIPGQLKPVIRTYSLSDYDRSPINYRLSIKRELAPADLNVSPGIASNFMHDSIHEDSIIWVKPPTGKFVLDVYSSKPAILISNGVGITPMIAMAKAAVRLNPLRQIWFLHGARDGSSHAFRDEINALSASNPNLHVIYCYGRPTATDTGNYHQQGYVDTALIQNIVAPEMQQLCGSTEADYFLCGSTSFMDALRTGLRAWGVPDKNVMFESFAKAMPTATETVRDLTTAQGNSVEIVFSKLGKTHTWHPADGTILEFAEANGLRPDYSCREGVCGTCMCKISAGEVEYEESPTASVVRGASPSENRGSVLICISKPKTAKVVLDL